MLAIAQPVVVRDAGVDLDFEIVREEVVLQQDAVLERLMPALDLSLGHRMMRCTTGVLHGGRRALWPGHRRGNSLHYLRAVGADAPMWRDQVPTLAEPVQASR